MQIAMIACMARNHVIGKENKMPWHLPADLAHFKSVTMSKPIVMGRKTYESIGRPLPGRQNIVISRQEALTIPGVEVVNSIDAAMALVAATTDELMVIGGGQLYGELLPRADTLYLTMVDAELDGDTHFPQWDSTQWREVSRERRSRDANNGYDLDFICLKRCVE
ncbi:type 3 dihydrofolate reductase [Ferrimonas lipolytica]|uniref:Dihydrofolate reductase n=1 Tax=Ferrimonas lipolytica TaxID=2724191 RepID=A0A6H1UGS2_9GAMM|nr:type 3 dihydrofolate reductase [Ferrimonas lipolytica]QIZ77829.1 type 3 dihydrofolate reductase [Ferrimonas lipolytica]